MAEKGIRPEFGKLDWNRVTQTEVLEPDPGLKDDGYPDGATPANEEHNSEFFELSNWATYLQIAVPRIFDSLAEALDLVGASSPLVPIIDGEVFRVQSRIAGVGFRQIGSLAQSTAAGAAVIDVATDGQQDFYAVAAGVSAIASAGGAAVGWGPLVPGGGVAIVIEADGLFLYVAITGGFVIMDPATGATVTIPAVVATAADPIDLAANGVKLLVALGVPGTMEQYAPLGAIPLLEGTYPAHGGAINACAIDADQGYYGGVDVSGNALRAVTLGTFVGFLWSTGFGGEAVTQLQADGAFVYVTTTATQGDQCVWCVSRIDGAIVWSSGIGGTGADELAVDDRYLWVGDDGTLDTHVLERATGARIATFGGDFKPDDADGFVVVGRNGTDLESRYKGDPETLFLKAGATDNRRRPIYALAAPIEDRELGARHNAAQPIAELYRGVLVTASTATFVNYFAFGGGPGDLFFTVPAGKYQITVAFLGNHTASTGTMGWRVRLDVGTLHTVAEASLDRNVPGAPEAVEWSQVVILAAGVHNVGLDLRQLVPPGTAEIYEAQITVERWA